MTSSDQPSHPAPCRRIVSGLGALLVLLVVIGAVPPILIRIAGDPLPTGSGIRHIGDILTRPDDGSVMIGLIAIIAWIAWLIFVIATVAELLAMITRQRVRIRLPGLRLPQRAAGTLLVLTAAMIIAGSQPVWAAPRPAQPGTTGSPAPAQITRGWHSQRSTQPLLERASPADHRQPATDNSHTTTSGDREPDRAAHRSGSVTPAAEPGHRGGAEFIHTVRRGDDLWTLAERYLGDGSQWRKISAANADLLTGGPDRLQPGWRLVIPAGADRYVRVSVGDSLSAIAEREYHDAAGWHAIFEANRDVIDDPDLVTPGMLLHVPDRSAPDATGGDHHRGNPDPRDRALHHKSANKPPPNKTGPSQTRKARHPDTAGPPQRSPAHKKPDHRCDSDTAPNNRAADQGALIPDATSAPDHKPETSAPDHKPETAPSSSKPASTAHEAADQARSETFDDWPWLAGTTGVLAAGLVAAIAARRKLQLVDRPVGRRIPQPPAAAQQLEARLGRRHTPGGLQLADLALRVIGAHAWHTGAPLPTLIGCRIERTRLELTMAESGLPAPDGFTVQAERWWMTGDDLAAVCDGLAAAGLPEPWNRGRLAAAPHPWPGLIPIGTDTQGTDVLLNLEYTGLLGIGSGLPGADEIIAEQAAPGSQTAQPAAPRASPASMLAGMLAAAAVTPWTTEANVCVIGDHDRWAPAIDQYNVVAVDNVEQLLQQWQRRAAAQRVRLDSKPGQTASRMRIGPDAGEAWSPQVALIGPGEDAAAVDRLQQLLQQQPSPALAAVVADADVECDWHLMCKAGFADLRHRARTEDGGSLGGADGTRSGAAETHTVESRPDAAPAATEVVLEPLGWHLVPQQIPGPAAEQLQQLLIATGSTHTTPAPWWAADFPPDAQPLRAVPESAPHTARGSAEPAHGLVEPDSDDVEQGVDLAGTYTDDAEQGVDIDTTAETSPVNEAVPPRWPSETAWITSAGQPDATSGVAPINTHDPQRWDQQEPPRNGSFGWQSGRDSTDSDEPVSIGAPRSSEESDIVSNPAARSDIASSHPAPGHPAPTHPMIRLLGPIDLLGGAGDPPSRATGQCLEYCAWLLEHPHSTARAMATGLVVAEGTRRSNMSRLRNWLGSDDQGEPYLPDAYSGRIALSPLVSSDWHRLQLLCQPGVNRTSTEGLCRALQLVRGAPLADAAPGQWHWAEEMRTDMISVLRDIGAELSERALAESDIDLARWAAARALTAAPEDERLVAARIRTEHLAGNHADVERLSLQLATQSRALGLDLDPETVDLLQQVMEGGLRARA
jgi:phage tail protein X